MAAYVCTDETIGGHGPMNVGDSVSAQRLMTVTVKVGEEVLYLKIERTKEGRIFLTRTGGAL